MNSKYTCTGCEYHTDDYKKLKYHMKVHPNPMVTKYHCDFGDCPYKTDTISKYRCHRLYHEKNTHVTT